MANVKITQAAAADVPASAEINRLSYIRETVFMFAFKAWPDEQNMRAFFTARVGERLHHPATQVFKAIDTAADRIVGFICWTRETAKAAAIKAVSSPSRAMQQPFPPFLDMDFVG